MPAIYVLGVWFWIYCFGCGNSWVDVAACVIDTQVPRDGRREDGIVVVGTWSRAC